MKITKPWVIGIDPGTNTGVAVWDTEAKEFVRLELMDFWCTYDFVTGNYNPDDVLLVIEDARLNKATFRHKGEGAYQDRLSRNVGNIQKECGLLIAGFERLSYDVRKIKPTPKDHKWDAATFTRYTGIKKGYNEHIRDAARLVWGM